MKTSDFTRLEIDFTRINNDVNGNPRFVCHFLEFKHIDETNPFDYSDALKIAKQIGGKRYHTKRYGGGIVFQTYNIEALTERILRLTGKAI